jgi:hypothetical protein
MRPTLKDYELIERTVLVVEEAAPEPVSIDYVSKQLSLSWGTARALLFQLALEGKLQAIKTTTGWFFGPKEERGKASEEK